jgi:hypothetical protein
MNGNAYSGDTVQGRSLVRGTVNLLWISEPYQANIEYRLTVFRSRGSSVSIVSDYGLDDRGSIPDRGQRIFLLASASKSALGPTQPPVQWVPGVLSPGLKRGRGVTLITHPHLVPRLSMSRSYTSSPPMCLHDV